MKRKALIVFMLLLIVIVPVANTPAQAAQVNTAFVVNTIHVSDITVTGKFIRDYMIRVYTSTGGRLGQGRVSATGDFSVQLSYKINTKTLLITYQQPYGSESRAISVNVNADPAKPVTSTPTQVPVTVLSKQVNTDLVVNTIHVSDTVVTGKFIWLSVIRIYTSGGSLIGQGIVESNGEFNVHINYRLHTGTTLLMTYQKSDGVESRAISVNVNADPVKPVTSAPTPSNPISVPIQHVMTKPMTLPSLPYVKPVTNGSTTVEGKTNQPNILVIVKIGDVRISLGYSDNYGLFHIDLPAYFVPGTKLTVTETNATIFDQGNGFADYASSDVIVSQNSNGVRPIISKLNVDGMYVSGSSSIGTWVSVYTLDGQFRSDMQVCPANGIFLAKHYTSRPGVPIYVTFMRPNGQSVSFTLVSK